MVSSETDWKGSKSSWWDMWCWSWAATAVSRSSGSEPGFLRGEMTAAILKLDGTTQEARDAFVMFSTGWQRMGRQA